MTRYEPVQELLYKITWLVFDCEFKVDFALTGIYKWITLFTFVCSPDTRQGATHKMVVRGRIKAKLNISTWNNLFFLAQRKFAYVKTDYATCNEQRRDATTVTSLQHTKKESARTETWSVLETIRRPLTLGAFVYIRVSSNRPPSVRYGSTVAELFMSCRHDTRNNRPAITDPQSLAHISCDPFQDGSHQAVSW